jgi:hypothetical protein
VAGTFNAQDVANTLWAYATIGREPGAGLMMRALEGRAEALEGTFKAQDVAITLWACATTGREPGEGLMRALEGRAEAVAGTFNAQEVAITLWVCAMMGREPGAGMMRALEGRAEAVAGTFNAQDVANTLWAACVVSILRAPAERSRWVDAVAQRLISLGKAACFRTAELRQLHQVFLWCSLDGQQHVEAVSDMQSLTDACREAFLGAPLDPSATQQQVSETLRHIGLSVEDEVRCPKSGYYIDMLVHDKALAMGGERNSSASTWAVEYDGPSHFSCERGANGCHPAEATASGASWLRPRDCALLGVEWVQGDRREGVVPEGQAGTAAKVQILSQ